MSKENTKNYYGLKEFADFAVESGVLASSEQQLNNTRKLAVYNQRGKLPIPSVTIGSKEGWTKAQIDQWIKEQQNQHK